MNPNLVFGISKICIHCGFSNHFLRIVLNYCLFCIIVPTSFWNWLKNTQLYKSASLPSWPNMEVKINLNFKILLFHWSAIQNCIDFYAFTWGGSWLLKLMYLYLRWILTFKFSIQRKYSKLNNLFCHKVKHFRALLNWVERTCRP